MGDSTGAGFDLGEPHHLPPIDHTATATAAAAAGKGTGMGPEAH